QIYHAHPDHVPDVAARFTPDHYPTMCTGMGGLQVPVGTKYANIYDHFAAVYEYDNGVKIFSNTRQMANCVGDMKVYALGAGGRAVLSERPREMGVTGAETWRPRGADNDFYQTEHDKLFAAIRQGRPINNGDYMARSTLMAIMARMAAYTGLEITWEQAMNSKEDLTPARYEWGKMPMPAVAMPGVTRFV